MIYKTKINYVCKRVGRDQYTKRDMAVAPWSVVVDRLSDLGLCGNVSVYFKRNKATLADDRPSDNIPSYQQISSALALYRSLSMFQTAALIGTCDYYKMNWGLTLRHKDTGLILQLGEWKGGFQIFTQKHSVSDLPKDYIRDAEILLTTLVSPTLPIDYDGTIAGSVA